MNLAIKWCAEKEWLHLDTMVFYAIARDVGALAFLGVAEFLPLTIPDQTGQYLLKTITALLCLIYAQGMERVVLPRDNLMVFYGLGALKYGAVTVGVVVAKFILFKIFAKKVKNS